MHPSGIDDLKSLVTIVITARNEEERIHGCLESCRPVAETLGVRIIVVDSRSFDQTASIARRWGAEVFTVPADFPHTPAGARNFGLCQVRSRYVQFLDADMLLERSWLERALAFLAEHPQVAGVAGSIYGPLALDGGPGRVMANEARVPSHLVCGLYQTEILKTSGGFDTRLIAAEDFELGCRLRGQGHRLATLPVPMAEHVDRGIHGWSELSRRRVLRYHRAYGQLLRYGIRTPWLRSLAWKPLRYLTFAVAWIGCLVASVIATLLDNPRLALLLLSLVLAAFLGNAVRKGSVSKAVLGWASWTLSGVGAIVGLIRPGLPKQYFQNSETFPAVLIFSRGTYPIQVGGREIFVSDIVSGVASRGTRVFLLTERDPGISHPNVRVLECPSRELPVIGFLLFAFRAFWAVARVRRHVLVFHAHSPRVNVSYAGFLSSFFGLPLIITAHCAGVEYPFSSFAYRRAARVVAVSDSIRTDLTRAGVPASRIEVIPSVATFPPAPDSMAEARRILGLQTSDFVVLYLGRMDEHKGIHLLVDAIRSWPPNRPLVALLVGDGPARARLAASWSPRPDIVVKWPGQISHDEVGIYYRAADVFVLPSLREGSPLVIFEAFQYGTPIIACDVPGVRDFLRDRSNALLVDRTGEALRDALIQLYDDRSVLESLRKGISMNLNGSNVIERHIDLYERVTRLIVRSNTSSPNHIIDLLQPPGDSNGH